MVPVVSNPLPLSFIPHSEEKAPQEEITLSTCRRRKTPIPVTKEELQALLVKPSPITNEALQALIDTPYEDVVNTSKLEVGFVCDLYRKARDFFPELKLLGRDLLLEATGCLIVAIVLALATRCQNISMVGDDIKKELEELVNIGDKGKINAFLEENSLKIKQFWSDMEMFLWPDGTIALTALTVVRTVSAAIKFHFLR